MILVEKNILSAGGNAPADGGFSLVELLIALTIFAVGVMAVVGLQTASIQGNMTSRLNIDETARAVAQLEALKGLDYDEDDLDPGDHSHVDGDPVWTVATVNAGAGNEYKTVQLTASWYDRGASKSFTIHFIRSKP